MAAKRHVRRESLQAGLQKDSQSGRRQYSGGKGRARRSKQKRKGLKPDMASGRYNRNYRQYNTAGTGQERFYVYGSAVRKAEAVPVRRPEAQPVQPKRTSSQVRKNRNRAMSISPAYAVFLAAAAVCAVMLCMMYLKLQSDVMNRSENVTALQQELADLTEANDTAYNAAADSVNLKEIKDRAMNEMGMVYASEGTVIEYDSPTGSYVKQYSDIPKDGILAQSKDVSE